MVGEDKEGPKLRQMREAGETGVERAYRAPEDQVEAARRAERMRILAERASQRQRDQRQAEKDRLIARADERQIALEGFELSSSNAPLNEAEQRPAGTDAEQAGNKQEPVEVPEITPQGLTPEALAQLESMIHARQRVLADLKASVEKIESEAKARNKGGRPKKEGPRPWEVEGISRAIYYRRRKEKKYGNRA
jgi:hypothetical protein